jgi:hypothetical protein
MRVFVLFLFSCLFLLSAASFSSPYLVVSMPFDTDSAGKKFSILSWNNSTISQTGVSFQLDKVTEGAITFIDGGQFGLVQTDRGKVSVFRIDSTGKPTVINADYRPRTCYANSVIADPANANRAYIIDVNVSGGICAISIDSSTGAISDAGQVMASTSPVSMLFPTTNNSQDTSGLAVVVSLSGVASLIDASTHAVIQTLLVFGTSNRDGSPDALVSDAVLTADNQFLLVLDNNSVTGSMRLSAVRMNWSVKSMATSQVINKLNDPAAIVASPYNNALVISSAQGNALLRLLYDPQNAASPITMQGAITTKDKPQLPNTMVLMAGPEAIVGRVAVAELSGVRQIQFTEDGQVLDLGLNPAGPNDESGNIVGAIGAQPAK